MVANPSHLISLANLHVGTEGKFLTVRNVDEREGLVEGFTPEPSEAPLLNGEADRLFEQYCRELEAVGITYVWHTLVQEDRSVHLISNKKWAERCLDGDYARFDVLDQAVFKRNQNIFFWRDLIEVCDHKQKMLMQERDFDYELRNGFTLSFEHRELRDGRYITSRSEGVTFATDSKTFDLPDFCLANYPLIKEYSETMTLLSARILRETSGAY